MNAWIGERYDAAGMALVDHSGLGPDSRVAPLVMARYLLAARREGVLPGLLRDFILRDAQGRENPAHPVSVLAKTGTLNFVSTLAGYAQMRGGRPVVFAIFSADLDRRRRISEAEGERPAGTRPWAGAARGLQQALIERWAQGAS
jgi:D-alanyl-D-alanine carboxypeptidase/D-alanyl-D-alanine-endopeptidase (penicillin-binding protein 4)